MLTVYDGPSATSGLLGRFSGSSIPATVTGSSGTMYVAFSADASVERSGFVATYSSPATASSLVADVPKMEGGSEPVSDGTSPLTVVAIVAGVVVGALMLLASAKFIGSGGLGRALGKVEGSPAEEKEHPGRDAPELCPIDSVASIDSDTDAAEAEARAPTPIVAWQDAAERDCVLPVHIPRQSKIVDDMLGPDDL